MLAAGLFVFAIPAGLLLRELVKRPQRAVLLLAALTPFDGLLLLTDGPDIRAAWKEGLILLTLAATFVAPRSARAQRPAGIPAWLGPVLAIIAFSLATGTGLHAPVLLAGLKVDHFYLLLPLILWRCPLDERERDHLVTVLMFTAVVTAAAGIAQQLLGQVTLNALGYDFNTVIRTAGDSVLRSFGTFESPFPFAFFVVFVVAVAVPIALQEPARLRNRLFLLCTPILVIGMLTAVVRAALLALVVAGLYHLIRNYRAALSLAPALLLFVAIAPSTLIGAVLSSRSLGQRVDGWSIVTSTVIAQPFGTGVGTTSSAAEVAGDFGGEIEETFGLPPDLLPYQPDNYYIKRLLELGAVGLWLTIAMLRHVIESAREVRNRAGPRDQALIDGWIASVLGAAAAATVATYWEIFPLDLYFYLLLGVLTSIDRAASPSQRSPSNQTVAASRPTFVNS
ncbi:MAG: O-antigen ligase family protein [Actinomycetota bacterium]